MSETLSEERASFLLSLTIFLQLNTKHDVSPFLLFWLTSSRVLCWSRLSRFPSLWAGPGFVLSYSSPLLHRLLLWFDRLELQVGTRLLLLLLCLACAICCPSGRRPLALPTCTYAFVSLCMIVWTPSLYILSVCVYTLLSLPQPPDPPVSIATGPPVVIVTITPTSLLLWRAKVCFSTPSHPHPPFVQQFCCLFFLLCFSLISVSSKMWYDQVNSAGYIHLFIFFVLGLII